MGVHVLLLPWASQGHLTAVLQLAHLLASQQDFLVTLALPARAQARLRAASSPLPQHPNIHIHVVEDGLNTDLSPPSYEQLEASIPIMQQSLESLLRSFMASSSPVTCLIAGTFAYWSQSVTRKLNIPQAELWSSPAYIYCCGFFYECLHSEGLVPFKGSREDTWITCMPGLVPMKASDYVQELLPSEEDIQANPERFSRIRNRLRETYQNAGDQFRVLVNSIYDLEREAFDALRGEHVSACAIGPLFLHNLYSDKADQQYSKQPGASMYKEDCTCLPWLDSKAAASTVYVAFGSESMIEKQDMQELAYGLEASGHSFLWVIRPGSVPGDVAIDEVLPEGFKERVGERGLVVSWAPQADVLSHSAIGCFLSHCGWNSTLEALWSGVPILAWPQRADQPINKKYIVDEWKVGIGIEKNAEGKISRIAIENGIRSLMQGKEAMHIRQAVKEVKELMCKASQDGGSSRRNLDQFIQDLRNLATEPEAA